MPSLYAHGPCARSDSPKKNGTDEGAVEKDHEGRAQFARVILSRPPLQTLPNRAYSSRESISVFS